MRRPPLATHEAKAATAAALPSPNRLSERPYDTHETSFLIEESEHMRTSLRSAASPNQVIKFNAYAFMFYKRIVRVRVRSEK